MHDPSRRAVIGAGLAVGIGSILPSSSRVASAQTKPIKVGFTSIFSGRVAQLGVTAKNGLVLEFEKFNAAGGLGGRTIELIDRDSKGRPEDAARLTRELIESEGCEIIICGEASGSAFAAHEVARTSNVVLIHAISETTQLTADPKLRSWNSFRTARQALHDSIVGGAFAAKIVKKNGFTKWATIAADYAYGRDATPEFMAYVQANGAKVELVAEAWPKLFQPDYTESITKILQSKPQAMFCGLWGGDLVAFIDQGNLFGLFDQVQVFAIHLADYTTLTSVKKLPSAGAYSSNRYVSVFPSTPDNAAWSEAYQKRFSSKPTNWSWEACAGARFVIEAIRKSNSVEPAKLAAAMKGMEIGVPVGAKDGKAVMRPEDQTIVDYALGWGRIVPNEPYLVDIEPANWGEVRRLETEWKKKKGFI